MSNERLHPDTAAVIAGRPPREEQAPVNPPVVLSSTYYSTGSPDSGALVYARLGTQTWLPLEEALAELEYADLPALAFASGMAAISAALDVIPAGGEVIIPRHVYHATLVAAQHLQERSGVTVTKVDIADTEQVTAALTTSAGRGHAPVLWVESPTNPLLEIADVPALAEATHAVGGLVIADNTFATPLGQRPLELGADVVVHSVTKYLAGHSDVILGAALTNSVAVQESLRTRRSIGGAVPGPWEAWLALRGMRTLALRVERSQRNAATLAQYVSNHPLVGEVCYPGLPTHPQHDRAAAHMNGFGSILTMRPTGGVRAAEAVTRAVQLWLPATSLGGVESSLERRRRFTAEAQTVPEDLLRLSVGIEDINDITNDLDRALTAAHCCD